MSPVILDEDCDDDGEIQVLVPDSPCVFIIDDEDDVADVQVFIPGPPGPPLIDIGTRAMPALVDLTIDAPIYRRQRSFLVGNAGPAINPSIANPSDNGAWELYLFGTDDTDVIVLESQSNLQLSGQWIGANGSILYLQWDGATQYVEGGRNEI